MYGLFKAFQDYLPEASSISDMIVGAFTVNDFSGLMSRSNMLPIIVFAIMSGFAVAKCGGEESWAGKLLNNLNNIIMMIVDMIMKLTPIGLGGYFANLVGEFGPQLIGDYGRTMLVYYPMCAAYVLIFFPLYSYFAARKLGISRMLKYIFNPAVTAFAAQSSVATLPVNMEACKKIGVPDDISNIVLPMGATMHMDGSVLSSITKIAFLFGVFQMLYAGGGLVGEMLIVSLFGFPAEAFPLIATIGFLVDPAATCLNASGDTIASMMIARLIEGKDWLDKRIANGQVEVQL